MTHRNTSIVCAAVAMLVACSSLSAAAIEWTNDGSWTAPTTKAPELTVTDLLVDGGAISSDARGTLNNGWSTGRTFTSTVTVPTGYELTITDWAVEEWQQWNGYLPTFTLDISGDATVALGSVTATATSSGGYQTFVLANDPADAALPAGTYTLSLFGQQTNKPGDNGGWMGLVTYTINGEVGQTRDAIPEPATMALLAVGGLAALLRRRRA